MLSKLSEVNITPEFVEDLKVLYGELSPKKSFKITIDNILSAVAQSNSTFLIFFDILNNRTTIVGMGIMHCYDTLIERKAVIDDVVVRESFRGKKIGFKIMHAMIDIAQNLNVKEINLSSRFSRVAAHSLYRSLGFESPDSTLFRFRFH